MEVSLIFLNIGLKKKSIIGLRRSLIFHLCLNPSGRFSIIKRSLAVVVTCKHDHEPHRWEMARKTHPRYAPQGKRIEKRLPFHTEGTGFSSVQNTRTRKIIFLLPCSPPSPPRPPPLLWIERFVDLHSHNIPHVITIPWSRYTQGGIYNILRCYSVKQISAAAQDATSFCRLACSWCHLGL